MNDADRSFAEFQRSGSPLALARVFDALAPELLLLAGHLVRDHAVAEDVLQQTFLDAIQVAHRFDPARGAVQRWLVGILVNHARKEQRKRRRELDPARAERERVHHPLGEAAAHEFLDAVRGTLDSLPPHYREVLRLGLLHGLDQNEISSALERPPETVKTQMRRGMDLLRRELPKGFALSVAVAFTAGKGITAIRRTVLEGAAAPPAVPARPAPPAAAAAEGAPSAAAAAGAAGPRAALGLAGIAVSALVLGLATLLAWPRGAGAGAGDPKPVSAAPGVEEPTPGTAPPLARVAQPVAPAAPLLRVSVHWSDRAPAAGVVVHARPAEDVSWLRELEARTDAGGTAVLALPGAGAWRLRGDRGGATTVLVAGAGETAAELEIPPGTRVDGFVFDSSERPLAGASVWLALPTYALDDCAHVATSAADGTFVLRDVTPGRVISVTSDRLVHRRAHVVADGPAGGYTFVLASPGAALDGTVLEADGTPARGAAVLVARLTYGQSLGRMQAIPWRLRADAEGRFRAAGLPLHERLIVWARTERSAASLQYLELDSDLGARIEIRLRRGASVRGVVRGAAATPVAGARVLAQQAASEAAYDLWHPLPEWARVGAASGPDGSFELPHVMPGAVALFASAEGLGVAREPVTLAEGEARRWDAALLTESEILGMVVGEDGAPLAGIDVGRRDPFNDRPVGTKTTTNATGRFRFRDCGFEPQGLLLLDPKAAFATPALRAVVTAGPAPLRLTVPDARRPSASLTVRPLDVRGGALDPSQVTFMMARIEGGTLHIGEGRAEVVPAGVRIAPLVPGTYDLVIASGDQADHVGTRFAGRFELGAGAAVDAGEVRLEQPCAVEVSVRDEATGRPCGGIVSIMEPRAIFATNGGRLVDGIARIPMQPGRSFLSLWSEDLPMTYRELTLAAGASQRVEILVPPIQRRNVVFPGVPEAATFLEIRCFDAAGRQVLEYPCTRTGKGGETVTRAFVPGSYELVVRDLAGRERRSRFTISADARGDEVVEVLLPE